MPDARRRSRPVGVARPPGRRGLPDARCPMPNVSVSGLEILKIILKSVSEPI